MAKTISELRNQSIQVRDASAAGENTATRVGTVLNDIVGHIEDYENTQSSNNSTQDVKIEGVKSSLNAEIARAKTEESNLSNVIGTERTERQAAVSSEETARIQADNAEKAARQQADNAEQDARIKADNAEKTARENADITLRTMIQTEVSDREKAVATEAARAKAAEQANAQAIADENARATTEEERLQGEIDNTNTNVETLDDKVNSNHDRLTDEVARLDLTDNEIKANLADETARAKAAEQTNAQAITDEAIKREDSDNKLSVNIKNKMYNASILVSEVSEENTFDLNLLQAGTSYVIGGGKKEYLLNGPEDLGTAHVIVNTSKAANTDALIGGIYQTLIEATGNNVWVRVMWGSKPATFRKWVKVIGTNSVTTSHIYDKAVTTDKLADDAMSQAMINTVNTVQTNLNNLDNRILFKTYPLISVITEEQPLDLNTVEVGSCFAVGGGDINYILHKPDDLTSNGICVITSKVYNTPNAAGGVFQLIMQGAGSATQNIWIRFVWGSSNVWMPWKKISGSNSVGTKELKDKAVTTDKLADGAVTKEKLSSNLQAGISAIDTTNNNMPITFIDSILFIGDSVTHGHNILYVNGERVLSRADYDLSYPAMLSKKCSWLTVNNKAVAGYNIQQAESIILPKCDCTENLCVIELGWNLRGGEGQYNTFYDTYDTDVAPYSDYNDYADTNMGIYCKMIEEIKEKNPNIIICLVCSQGWGANNTNRTAAVHRIATEYNLPIIDFNDENLYPVNYRQNSDGTHSTIWGYALKAEYFIKGLGIALRDHNLNVAELIYKQKGLLT